MKILFITNNYTPYSGGLVSSIQASVTELLRQGHEPLIATLDFLGQKHDDPAYVIRIPSPIKFCYKTNPMAVPWRATQQLEKIMRKMRPDIVHLHHPFLLGSAGLAAARKLGIPVVFTYHTMYEKYAHYVPLLKELTAPLIERIVLRFCTQMDGIIVPSSGVKEWLQARSIAVPMEVIPSGLRDPFLNCQRDFSAGPHDPFRLLYVGRFTYEKNIPSLLEMFARLPKGKYVLSLVGFGADEGLIKQMAFEKLRLDQRFVTFIERPENLVEQYSQADLFIFPSQTDTQGIVLAESLAQGTPIVALEGFGQRDAIIDGENGFLVQSQGEMIEAIARIASNSQLHATLCKNAVASAGRYAPEVVTDRLINFYETIEEHS